LYLRVFNVLCTIVQHFGQLLLFLKCFMNKVGLPWACFAATGLGHLVVTGTVTGQLLQANQHIYNRMTEKGVRL